MAQLKRLSHPALNPAFPSHPSWNHHSMLFVRLDLCINVPAGSKEPEKKKVQ